MSVTQKLRQVEQAIRAGGVLFLCHAEQLFESLYMVLNQQYWASEGNTMTQIALGPSTRSITLPDGPFRIIALQVIASYDPQIASYSFMSSILQSCPSFTVPTFSKYPTFHNYATYSDAFYTYPI